MSRPVGRAAGDTRDDDASRLIAEVEAATMRYFNDVLGPEDVQLVESVQRGLHSRGYHQGRFMIDPDRGPLSEHAVHHFQLLVHNALANAPE